MASDLHSAWAALLVHSLAEAGARAFVISPGSRSTPLTLAAARHPGVRCHSVIDERAAGFFALGLARVTGRPAVLVCTSGTAPTHYLPALTEAHLVGLPVIALSADRPWEAYHCASPQTIDQTHLFGDVLRHRAELGAPEAGLLDAVVRVASQCVARSLGPEPGPVHLNARFRKPLEPVVSDEPEPWRGRWQALMRQGPTKVFQAPPRAHDAGVAWLVKRLEGLTRVWVVCGPSMGVTGRLPVGALAQALGAVWMAEATSQQRWSGPEAAPRVDHFDTLLRAEAWLAGRLPELIIEVGMPAVSMAYTRFVAQHRPARVVLAPSGWNDPTHDAEALFVGAVAETLDALVAALAGRGASHAGAAELRAWAEADAVVETALRDAGVDAWGEPEVVATLAARLPEGAALMVGNSMPVRDLDVFSLGRGGRALQVLHQRGASGIDGLIAGAAGARAGLEAARPVVLLLGDVSALHDLGGLAVARDATAPLVVVVVNNGGGRIFAELPLGPAAARDARVAEAVATHFLTPPRLDLSAAGALFGVQFARVTATEALEAALDAALQFQGCTLIEAVVSGEGAAARRRALVSRVTAALGGAP
ncbi:MAG: 2-succinyl-5-enolpyruvyl-6-hydroxy-3-cyclohexene-1-carboxylic-acid synthase [Myxococcales bacterium]|nr:2-succinyl-5-enolpyruvyl-6-hydroxy-3-cyclohexene-1-carboxylic-acid synthase [Myxococcales bacterium]